MAAYLSINDFKRAVSTLVRANELYLAFIISQKFYKKALKEISLLLAERAERYFCIDIALDLLEKNVKDPF